MVKHFPDSEGLFKIVSIFLNRRQVSLSIFILNNETVKVDFSWLAEKIWEKAERASWLYLQCKIYS